MPEPQNTRQQQREKSAFQWVPPPEGKQGLGGRKIKKVQENGKKRWQRRKRSDGLSKKVVNRSKTGERK